MQRPYLARNAASRGRLQSFTQEINEEDSALLMPNGWTIKATLVHLAFWDHRALVLIERWKQSGVGLSPIDIDATNDALKPLLEAIPHHKALALVLTTAEEIDRELENAPDSLIQEIERLGKFRLNRAEHRLEHIEEIEVFLATKKKGD